jgi:hypothetical protein
MNVLYPSFLVEAEISALNVLNSGIILIKGNTDFCRVRTQQNFCCKNTIVLSLNYPTAFNQCILNCPGNIFHFVAAGTRISASYAVYRGE